MLVTVNVINLLVFVLFVLLFVLIGVGNGIDIYLLVNLIYLNLLVYIALI